MNTELNTVFFHDHLFANSHQQHGVFGALIVEEAGATFHNIRTGKELAFGTRAVIKRKDGTSFREFALFVHDFALLFDKEGRALNPPEVPGSHDDPGVMGINYRCEPMRERLKCHDDPAYIFSSLIHKDPATPILETYPGDEIIIRLLDGAHEEQHAFNLTGLSWKKEITNIASPVVASQTLGISEAYAGDRVIFHTVMPADKPRNVGFCIHGHSWKKQPEDPYSHTIPLQGAISIGNTYNMELKNGAAAPGDYLYRSGSFKWDVESGMWGIFRVLRQGIGCTCRNICRKAFECVCKTTQPK